jgi:hypothetical protein
MSDVDSLDNLSSEERETKLAHLRAVKMVNGLLNKFVFSVRQIAEIITDNEEPITETGARKWTNGELLSIRPGMKVPGYKKPQFGHRDVCTFLLAKKLIRGFSGVPIPAKGIQVLLDAWTDTKFLPGIDYAERMRGRLILVPDRKDPANLQVFYFRDIDQNSLAAAETLNKSGVKFVAVCLSDIVDEVFERILCWANDEKFHVQSNDERMAQWLKVFKSAGHLVREVNSAEGVLKR